MSKFTLIEELNYVKYRATLKFNSRAIEKAIYMRKLLRQFDITNAGTEGSKLTTLNRTKKQIQQIIENNLNNTSAFITLTYAKNMQDYNQAKKDFNIYIKKLKQQYGTIKYICVKELQPKRGAIHYHLLIFNYDKSMKLRKYWKHGFSFVKRIYNVEDPLKIANYMSKYLTKGNQDHKLKYGVKTFTRSNNLFVVKKIKITHKEMFNVIDNTDKKVGFYKKNEYLEYLEYVVKPEEVKKIKKNQKKMLAKIKHL